MIGIGRFVDKIMDGTNNKRLSLDLKDGATEETEDTISNPNKFNQMKK